MLKVNIDFTRLQYCWDFEQFGRERKQWELTWIQLGGLGDLGKGMHTEFIIMNVASSMSSGSPIFFLLYVLKKIGEPGDEANKL